MSQAFFTAIGGISTAQTKINVVADNIANMSTVAFKQSSVTFENIYSQTLTTGSAASEDSGGTNAMQVGLGVTVSSISRNFSSGTIQTTGQTDDLSIQGSGTGYFTLQSSDGSLLLTRAGRFSLDGEGNLVTSDGTKVLGTDSLSSSTSSSTTVKVPPSLCFTVEGSADAGTKDISDLNNCDISYGDFTLSFVDGDGNPQTVTVSIDSTNGSTLEDIANTINSAITGAGFAAGAFTASVSDGQITFSVDSSQGSGATSIASVSSMSDGTSNFISETDLVDATGTTSGTFTTYSSKTLDYSVTISAADNSDNTTTLSSHSIGTDGAISATYSNGATLSVETTGNSKTLVYTTADGVEISFENITVTGDVVEAANLQIQMANVVNEGGLVSSDGNTFTVGPNAGEVTFSVPGSNGFGTTVSGSYESSNVDLSTQFAEMIIAQRQIDANSRTFQAANEVMKRVVQMGG